MAWKRSSELQGWGEQNKDKNVNLTRNHSLDKIRVDTIVKYKWGVSKTDIATKLPTILSH